MIININVKSSLELKIKLKLKLRSKILISSYTDLLEEDVFTRFKHKSTFSYVRKANKGKIAPGKSCRLSLNVHTNSLHFF